MTSISQAAIAASVIVGMISIPTVSQSAINQNPQTEQLPEINQPNSPRQVTRTNSVNGFKASIDTAMQEFSTFVSSESANATLETSTSDLEVSRSSGQVKWMLRTPEGRLEIRQGTMKTVQITETPEGTLKQVENQGTVKTSFKGSERQEVEKARKELKNRMEEKKEQLNQKRQQLKQTGMPEIEIIANESTGDGFEENDREHVVIVNKDFETLDLDGWTIQNDNPDTYEFSNIELEPGQKLKVYSSDADEIETSEDSVTGTELSWGNYGDTATLKNQDGTVVAETEY